MAGPPPGAPPEAPPPEAPPGGQADIGAIVAKIEVMPTEQALDTLAEIFADNPEVLRIIEQTRQESPEEQAATVKMILDRVREVM